MEFEIKNYDDAVKNSEYKQLTETPTAPSAPADTAPDTKIKQEPVEEVTTTPTPEATQPETPKVPAAVRKLKSDLDGKAWECTSSHRQRFKVTTASVDQENEYLESWDNVIHMEEAAPVEEE